MALWLHTTLLLVLLAASCPGSGGITIQPLCGGELIDALSFVCGDGGFVLPMLDKNPAPAQKRRRVPNIVEQCCYKPCQLTDLVNFCS